MFKNLRWKAAQFFEIRWWKLYLGNKDKAAYLDWKTKYWRDFLEKSDLSVPSHVRVLDAGCGPAGIFTIFTEQTTDAVDPLLDQYERELSHFSKEDWPNVHFHCCALEDFHTEQQYPYVFCLNAINHVADLNKSLDQLAAFTAPGGTLAMSIDAHNHQVIKHLFRLQPSDILHPHQYDLVEYQDMLTQRGFEVKRSVLFKKELIFSYYLIIAQKEPSYCSP